MLHQMILLYKDLIYFLNDMDEQAASDMFISLMYINRTCGSEIETEKIGAFLNYPQEDFYRLLYVSKTN